MAFNKMFVMLPVMFAARKLDGEDPMTVYYLRIAYGAMQAICVLIVLYTYWKATAAATHHANKIVYVPPAPTVRTYVDDETTTTTKRFFSFLVFLGLIPLLLLDCVCRGEM
jgi:Phosphate transport (Pho88)